MKNSYNNKILFSLLNPKIKEILLNKLSVDNTKQTLFLPETYFYKSTIITVKLQTYKKSYLFKFDFYKGIKPNKFFINIPADVDTETKNRFKFILNEYNDNMSEYQRIQFTMLLAIHSLYIGEVHDTVIYNVMETFDKIFKLFKQLNI